MNNKSKVSIENYYRDLTDKRSKRIIKTIDELCLAYLKINFEKVVMLDKKELLEYKNLIDNNGDDIKIKFNSVSGKNTNYISGTLYKNISKEYRRMIYNKSELKVCPYCNRTYLDLIHDSRYRNNFELDHLYPKSKYPMFAVSFYNLIPICGFCNKQKNNLDIGTYPFVEGMDKVIFNYKILGSRYLTNIEDIAIEVEKNDMADFWMNYLNILYNQHKDVAQEVLQKTFLYSKGYMDSLEKQFGSSFGAEDFKKMIYGVEIDKKQYGVRPLSKFIYDIYNQANQPL